MKSLSQLILKAIDTYNHVTVFTQSLSSIEHFLFQEPGKWNVHLNEKWWPKLHHKSLFEGKVIDGYKVGVVPLEESTIGIDCKGEKNRILFTKNPLIELPEKTFIIKDHFSFPKLDKKAHLPPILAMQKIAKNIILCPDGIHSYLALHDQFCMQGIDHSLETSGEMKSTHLINAIDYLDSSAHEAVVIYGFKRFQQLFKLHNFDKLVLIRPYGALVGFNYEHVEKIYRCFSELPEFGLTSEFIGFKIVMHPKTVKKVLDFLSFAGSIIRVRTDQQQITIYKRGTAPDSLEFHSIPEGTFKIASLVKHLQISRADLFPLLKKYEANGLIFSYTPSDNTKLWALKKELTSGEFQDAMRTFAKEEALIEDFIGKEDEAVNSFLEERIQTYCLNNKSEAIFHHAGDTVAINPTAKNFAF